MSAPSGRPLHILCIDDEPSIRGVLSLMLGREGHLCEVAVDGADGWAKAGADIERFDVVVTDFQMPNISGLGLVQRLRDAGFAGRVIVFSSSLAPHDRENFEHLGVDAIVEKGAPMKVLLAEIERPIERNSDAHHQPQR